MELASAALLCGLLSHLHAVCPELALPLLRDGRTRGECARLGTALSGVSYADAWGGGWREESGGQIWSRLCNCYSRSD